MDKYFKNMMNKIKDGQNFVWQCNLVEKQQYNIVLVYVKDKNIFAIMPINKDDNISNQTCVQYIENKTCENFEGWVNIILNKMIEDIEYSLELYSKGV